MRDTEGRQEKINLARLKARGGAESGDSGNEELNEAFAGSVPLSNEEVNEAFAESVSLSGDSDGEAMDIVAAFLASDSDSSAAEAVDGPLCSDSDGSGGGSGSGEEAPPQRFRAQGWGARGDRGGGAG